MRCLGLLITAMFVLLPSVAAAQVSVTSPAAGAPSSYRNTVITWDPIPGASSYHLEIDDDPAFGSPEVDVTVPGTSYAMSGETLKLHGQVSWAAYVRINGIRWVALTFTPSHFRATFSAMAVDSQNRAYLGLNDGGDLVTSSDWSNITHVAPGSAGGFELAAGENDVAHAFWYQRDSDQALSWDPYYANSSTGWDRVPLGGPILDSCAPSSIVAKGGQIDLFVAARAELHTCDSHIFRWTSTDGVNFTVTGIPNNDSALNVGADRDAVGNLYVASERSTPDLHSSLQTSADGWIPHRVGPGRFPSLAVTLNGQLHVLRWGSPNEGGGPGVPILYSNSLRGFQTWTELPVRPSSIIHEALPLVLDPTRGQLHTVLPGDQNRLLCSAANTGLAADTGTSWTCTPIVPGYGGADLALGPDGTIHLAWNAGFTAAYANSLGSFLAANLTPQVSFGTPSGTASEAIVPTTVSDPDGDDVSGDIHVGQYEPVTSLVPPGGSARIVERRETITNSGNASLYDPNDLLLRFRVEGSGTWSAFIHRSSLPALPVMVEVGVSDQTIGIFAILSWDDAGATISQIEFVGYETVNYSGTLPQTIDISTLPVGDLMLAVSAWDGSTSAWRPQAFTKASGQTQLRLTPPAEP